MLPFLRRHALPLSALLCLLAALVVFSLPPIEPTAPPAAKSAPSAAFIATAKAAENVTPEPQRNEVTVYVTRTGEKYHRGSCHHLRQSKYPMSLGEAKRRGYEACKVCRPPR